jgi:hypothetical protein
MAKTKLTLYVDETISRLAHRRAKQSGKSVSALVGEFLAHREEAAKRGDIAESVTKWIGLLKSRKSYKQLREEHIEDRLRRHEGSD